MRRILSFLDMPDGPPMLARAAASLLRGYSRVAPTDRGGWRLARMARTLYPKDQWEGVFRTADGFTIRGDLAIYPDCAMAFGLYELDIARVLKRLLRPGDHFVDGGANIGYFTLTAATLVGPRGRVDAFEPMPETHARLAENVSRNGFDAIVRRHQAALSDHAGQAQFHYYLGPHFNHGCSSLFTTAGVETRDVTVETRRMDDALSGTTPRLVKLDVQGAEPLVVAGMEGLLKGDAPPAVIAEYYPPCSDAAGFAPRETIDRILRLQPRYRMYRIGRGLRLLDPNGPEVGGLGTTKHGEDNLLFSVDPLA